MSHRLKARLSRLGEDVAAVQARFGEQGKPADVQMTSAQSGRALLAIACRVVQLAGLDAHWRETFRIATEQFHEDTIVAESYFEHRKSKPDDQWGLAWLSERFGGPLHADPVLEPPTGYANLPPWALAH